jgi:hypothetical protein
LKKSATPGSQGRRWRLAFFKARESQAIGTIFTLTLIPRKLLSGPE